MWQILFSPHAKTLHSQLLRTVYWSVYFVSYLQLQRSNSNGRLQNIDIDIESQNLQQQINQALDSTLVQNT